MKPRHIERVYPYVVAAILAVAYGCFHVPFPSGMDILNSSMTIGAILIGFLATAKSIIATLTSEKWQRFKGTQFFGLLTSYLEEAIYSALLYCIWCMIGYFVHPAYFGVIWFLLSMVTLLTFVRISHHLTQIISNV